jgi:hypothetical protein
MYIFFMHHRHFNNEAGNDTPKTKVTRMRDFTSFGCKCPTVGVDILPHIILLGQVEQLTDFGSSLGTSHPWLLNISQAR